MKLLLGKYLTASIAIVSAIVIVGGGIWYVSANRAPSFSTVAVTQGNVIETLDEPGAVMAENNVDLSFQAAGQVAILNVREGQAVSQGMLLASLDTSGLSASVAQADASVAQAQARLDSLLAGTRPEQLAVSEAAVANASSALSASIGSAYAAADDAIHNQTDNLFTNPNFTNPVFLIPDANSQRVIDIQTQRIALGAALASWYNAMSSPTSTSASLSGTAASVLQQISSYLNTVALSANSALPNTTLSAAALAGYKANVATSRTEVNTAITALTAAQAALQNASSALTLAEAGSTSQDIEAQKAAVQQAQAAAESARVALRHAELIAPFSGVVNNLSVKVGQVVSPGAPMLSLVNSSGLTIKTFVSEADVAKIKVGDAAQVTLDALNESAPLEAVVTSVASTQNQSAGSPSYEVNLHFKDAAAAAKDGMSGNVRITVGERDNVMSVPSRLVLNDGDRHYLLVREGGTTTRKEISIGLVGADMTEIISGVRVGDQIVNF